ncbi:acetylornithine deacetylase/succinyl-diaminopimelate desuccinylase family protein [Oceanomicrobium pacificus]
MTDIKADFLARVDAARDDLVALTRDLIRIPTLNPPGDCYREICELLDRRLTASGFETEFIRATGAPGDCDRYPRWNIVATRTGGGPGDCVHFNSHTDVVDVGAGWTVDPFAADVRDGRIYGRGACDMKGGLAASIIAAECLIAAWPDHPGRIEISGTADEESGGYGGVAHLAGMGRFSPARVQHVIIPEPLNKDRVCLGHRGVWWAEVETHGHIAHGSMPFLGDCAVRHMGALLAEMEAELFPALAEKRTAMPVVPPQARQSTLNINSLHGGQAEPDAEAGGYPSPVVPDSCRMVIDRRFLVEEDLSEVKAEFRALLDRLTAARPGFSYSLRDLHEVIPTMTDRQAPVVGAVADGVADIIGHAPEYVVSPGTYDQKHIDRIGRLKDCIAYGPGILDLAHQPDEWIGIQDMVDSAKVMGLALMRLLPGAAPDQGRQTGNQTEGMV